MSTETTHEVKTKSGKIAVLRNSISYGQDRAITNVYLDETLTRSQARDKADKLGIESVVAMLDGSAENIYDRFLKLDLADAREIASAIKLVLDPKVETPETASNVGKN